MFWEKCGFWEELRILAKCCENNILELKCQNKYLLYDNIRFFIRVFLLFIVKSVN